jgi:hypothetical protein
VDGCEVLRETAYAARDLARGVRAAVVRRGAVEVAALARGLSVRAIDAIVVAVWVVECVCFRWIGGVMVHGKDMSENCRKGDVGGRIVGRKGRKAGSSRTTSQAIAYTENDISAEGPRLRRKAGGENVADLARICSSCRSKPSHLERVSSFLDLYK